MDTFNRTIVELKLAKFVPSFFHPLAFNRTIVELKRLSNAACATSKLILLIEPLWN